MVFKLKTYADAILDQQIENICNWLRGPRFNLPVYADNTTAKGAGMVAGQTYRTATGQVMVVY